MIRDGSYWIGVDRDDETAVLRSFSVAVASVKPDGTMTIYHGWRGTGDFVARAANKRQGMRFVERLIQVRGMPFKFQRRGVRSDDSPLAALLADGGGPELES